MNKRYLKTILLFSIFLTLLGYSCLNPLKLNFSSLEIDVKTPHISDLHYLIWENNGTVICNETGGQYDQDIVSDGNGGAVLVWADLRGGGNEDIYAQRINRSGNLEWTSDKAICTESMTAQTYPKIISDGFGGYFITWQDNRGIGFTGWDIYAQRINSDGNPLWKVDGIVICNSTDSQSIPEIISDGSNGAIITWKDKRDEGSSGGDIYAQRIDSNGLPLWGNNGTVICNAIYTQNYPILISDDAGGAIISWSDTRNTGSPDADIYIQRVNSNGIPQWGNNGTSVCSATEHQYAAGICSDGNGGVLISWSDNRNAGFSDYDVYVQHINSNGVSQWGNNGTTVCNMDGDQNPSSILSDGMGGAIIPWTDKRNDAGDVYVQWIDSNKETKWDDNGTAICTQSAQQDSGDICTDGKGGAIVFWSDRRDWSPNYRDIYAQHITQDKSIDWTLNGEAICNVENDQRYTDLITDGAGNIIISWKDSRDTLTTGSDIYAQYIYIDSNPTSNHPGSVITSATGTETIDWILDDDNGGGQYRVWANNSFGIYYVWEDWAPWVPSVPFSVPINRTLPGDYNYTIEYYDDQAQYGIPDTVIVEVTDSIPTSNHPVPIITTKGGSETINWILNDDFGEGEYRVIANNSLGSNYVWVDWTAWTNSISLVVPINRTVPGDFEYTIEFDDDHDQMGTSDSVIITINNALPTSNHPIDINIEQNETRNINWMLSDDYGGGQYRILVNGTAGSWFVWMSGVQIEHPVDTATLGVFNYTIQYNDLYGLYGISDTVIVTIEDSSSSDGNGDDGDPQIPGFNLLFVFTILTLFVLFSIRKIRLKTRKNR